MGPRLMEEELKPLDTLGSITLVRVWRNNAEELDWQTSYWWGASEWTIGLLVEAGYMEKHPEERLDGVGVYRFTAAAIKKMTSKTATS